MKNIFKKKRAQDAGYTLIESIIYVSLIALMVSSIVFGLSSLTREYKTVRDIRRIENSALGAMDRMVRDIRKSTSVDTGNSVFGSAMGALRLFQNASTTEFYLSDGRILVEEEDLLLGPITATAVNVTALRFYHISATTSESVRIELIIENPNSSTTPYNFYNTAVLRGSYE